MEPLQLGYLVANLTAQSDHEARIALIGQKQSDEDFLGSWSYDVLGLSVYNANLPSARRLTKAAKEAGKFVIWGGPLPTGMPSIIRGTGADCAIIGEGEFSLLEVMESLGGSGSQLEDIPGLALSMGSEQIHITPPREFITDLNTLPFPCRDIYPALKSSVLEASFVFEKVHPQVSPALFSRGCLFACPYCMGSTSWHQTWRCRSPENMLAEMEELKERKGSSSFSFLDADIIGIPQKSDPFFQSLIEHNYEWMGETSPTNLTRERLSLMRKSGCRGLFLGIESGSPEVQRWIRKGLDTKEKLDRTIDMVRFMEKIGIKCICAFLVGLPPENHRTLSETRDFVRKLPASFCWFSFPHPYPGTEIHRIALEKGWMNADTPIESLGNTASPSVPSVSLSKEEIKSGFWTISRSFYFWKHFWRKIASYILRNPYGMVVMSSIGLMVFRLMLSGFWHRLTSSGKPDSSQK